MHVRDIDISAIEVGARLRAVDPVWVEALADDIDKYGQATPIQVIERGAGYLLVDGARRIKAVAYLGRGAITAVVAPETSLADVTVAQLGEIRANLMRAGLTVLEHARYVDAWREAYLRAHLTPKRGRPAAETVAVKKLTKLADISSPGIASSNENQQDPFVQSLRAAAQIALGISPSSLSRILRIASIDPELGRRLGRHAVADNQAELLALAGQSPERQSEIVTILVEGRAKTVADAIKLIDNLPSAPDLKAHERLYEVFSRWRQEERTAFYDLNRDDIERWMSAQQPAKRKLRTGR